MNVKVLDKEVTQYVVFKVGEQEFGSEIDQVAIIEKELNFARVPTTPDYIKGVVNLRGDILPVMSLRLKFNLPEIEFDDDARVIIFNINESMLGVVVDIVSEVISVSNDDIEGVSNITTDRSLDYISGITHRDGRLITLLNIEKLISELIEK